MQHVDDGILHAYIDGALDALSDAGELPDGATAGDVVAHLGACADCRARLEAERGIRERAGLILRDVSLLHVATPPHAAAAEPRRRAVRGAVPLTWAASVLLAVGAGWWGGVLWREQDRPAATRESVQDSGAAQLEALAGENASRTVTDNEPDVGGAGGSAPPVAGDAATGAATFAPARNLAGRASEAPEPLAAAPPADTRARNEADTVRSTVAQLDARFAQPAPTAQPGRPLAEDRRAISAALPPPTPALPEVLMFRSGLERAQANALRWESATAADTSGLADRLLMVSGASDPAIEVARETGRTTIRVRQVLANGDSIELITWREDALALNQLVTVQEDARVSTRDSAVRERTAGAVARAAAPQAPPPPSPAAATESAKAAATPAPVVVVSGEPRTMSDGRSEVIVRAAASRALIALRADVPAAELRALTRRLVPITQARR